MTTDGPDPAMATDHPDPMTVIEAFRLDRPVPAQAAAAARVSR